MFDWTDATMRDLIKNCSILSVFAVHSWMSAHGRVSNAKCSMAMAKYQKRLFLEGDEKRVGNRCDKRHFATISNSLHSRMVLKAKSNAIEWNCNYNWNRNARHISATLTKPSESWFFRPTSNPFLTKWPLKCWNVVRRRWVKNWKHNKRIIGGKHATSATLAVTWMVDDKAKIVCKHFQFPAKCWVECHCNGWPVREWSSAGTMIRRLRLVMHAETCRPFRDSNGIDECLLHFTVCPTKILLGMWSFDTTPISIRIARHRARSKSLQMRMANEQLFSIWMKSFEEIVQISNNHLKRFCWCLAQKPFNSTNYCFEWNQ